MTLGQLRTFLEVVRQGSVRGASAMLSVTEASVSSGVKSLQTEVGAPLVERQGRGIRVTSAGFEFARYASMILDLNETAIRKVQETANREEMLRLSSVVTAGEHLMAPVLKLFMQSRPEVGLRMEVGNQASVLEALISFRADLGIGGRPPKRGDVVGEPFLPNRLIIVGPADHQLAAQPDLDPKFLKGETWLLRESGSGTRLNTEELFVTTSIGQPNTMTLGSNEAVKQAAAAGLGVTLISAHAVAKELAEGVLVRLSVKGTPLDRAWHVLYRAGGQLSSGAQAFVQLLRSPLFLKSVNSCKSNFEQIR